MGSALSIQGLTKHFGKLTALDGVSFEVPEGSLFGLLGPNGAGKTTLFSVAAGFLKSSGGRVEVLGIDVAEISQLRGRFSMLPQDAAFQGSIPVIDQLVMFARLNGFTLEEAQERSQQALDLVGLSEVSKRNARALSHGMMKRVALCQAFLGDFQVILLDEPTSGLDPENARRMREIIRKMREEKTVVLSSHNLQEIQDLCDHVAILDHGKLVLCGTMNELTGASFLMRVGLARPLSAEAYNDLIALPVVSEYVPTSELSFNLKLSLGESADQEAALKAIYETFMRHQVYPRSIHEGASLETRFLEITGGVYDGASST